MNMNAVTTPLLFGDFTLVIDGSGLVRLSGFGPLEALLGRLPADLQHVSVTQVASHPYQAYLRAYAAGDISALSAIPYVQDGTDFQQRIWQLLADIPAGSVVAYKELAERAGRPAAVRAVGTHCGRNRLPLLVPCHRVVRSGGDIGSYLYGTETKRMLLRHEKQAFLAT